MDVHQPLQGCPPLRHDYGCGRPGGACRRRFGHWDVQPVRAREQRHILPVPPDLLRNVEAREGDARQRPVEEQGRLREGHVRHRKTRLAVRSQPHHVLHPLLHLGPLDGDGHVPVHHFGARAGRIRPFEHDALARLALPLPHGGRGGGCHRARAVPVLPLAQGEGEAPRSRLLRELPVQRAALHGHRVLHGIARQRRPAAMGLHRQLLQHHGPSLPAEHDGVRRGCIVDHLVRLSAPRALDSTRAPRHHEHRVRRRRRVRRHRVVALPHHAHNRGAAGGQRRIEGAGGDVRRPGGCAGRRPPRKRPPATIRRSFGRFDGRAEGEAPC